MKSTLKMIDGFSVSAWKSLAVKSLRIGWPNGLKRAEDALGKSEIKQILICGVFEDIFPGINQLPKVIEEVRQLDYDGLCARETHHGRGLTARFCELEPMAVEAAKKKMRELWEAARPYGLWLPRRSLNCWWTWLEMAPHDQVQRKVDLARWVGMPTVMLDGHTMEGKKAGTIVTLLSGHYHNHLKLSKIVAEHGWQHVRRIVHAKTADCQTIAKQANLFGGPDDE